MDKILLEAKVIDDNISSLKNTANRKFKWYIKHAQRRLQQAKKKSWVNDPLFVLDEVLF